jgi:hypothetical protein
MKTLPRSFYLQLIYTGGFYSCKKDRLAVGELFPLVGGWKGDTYSPYFHWPLLFPAWFLMRIFYLF